jgi:hypothetical protein
MNHLFFGYEKLDFATAIAREDERLAGEEERIMSDPRYRSFAHKHYSYVARGMYAAQLERWYEHFAAGDVFVAPSEDLFSDPAGTLHRVQAWLGLAEHTPADLRSHNTRSYSSMDPEVRAQLRERFQPDNARLRALTGVTFPWVEEGL